MKHLIQLLKQNKKEIAYFLAGILLIIDPFYWRVIRTRLPRNIEDLNIYFCICIVLVYLLIVFTLIYKYVKYSYFKDKPPNKHILFLYNHTFKHVNTFISESFKTVDDYIKHTLLGPKYLGLTLQRIAEFVVKNLGIKYKTYRWLYILFFILPRIFVLCCFIMDVTMSQIKYTYMFAWLLLVPLLSNYLLFTYKEFSEHNILLFCDEVCIIKFHVNPEEYNNPNSCAKGIILNECCKAYQADILEYIPDYLIKRKEALVIDIQRTYYLRESTYENTLSSPSQIETYFDEQIAVFTLMRQIRDIIYELQMIKFKWTYLYFEIAFFSIYLSLWTYIIYKLYVL